MMGYERLSSVIANAAETRSQNFNARSTKAAGGDASGASGRPHGGVFAYNSESIASSRLLNLAKKR
jgi:hypothetical protein